MKNSILDSRINLYILVSIYLLNYHNISYGQELQFLETSQDEKSIDFAKIEMENRNIGKCKPLWYNKCNKDSDCCSQKCTKGQPHWEHGVCDKKNEQPEGTDIDKSCQPLWYNKCKESSECCSKKCTKGRPDWEYGICDKNDGQPERTEINEGCKPLWYNKCTKDSDCCTKSCLKEQSDWEFGVCHNKIGQPEITGTHEAQWSITVDEFQKCAASFGHGTPSENISNAFISQAQSKGSITSKLEAFMAIAQFSWESAGFTARSEWACSDGKWIANTCDSYLTRGCPAGRKYYGRGYIQLSHCYNYKAASVDFPGIVENPDLVATDDRIAMGTALWFWKTNVHKAAGVQQGAFGSTTRAINGGLECTPTGNTNLAKQRWNKFNACLQSAGSKGLSPKEEGCYTDNPKIHISKDESSSESNATLSQ